MEQTIAIQHLKDALRDERKARDAAEYKLREYIMKWQPEKERVEKRYDYLFNYSQALICTYDMTGMIQSVNPATCRILEYAEDEIVGRYLFDFMPEKAAKEFKSIALPALSLDIKKQVVLSIITKGGEKKYLLAENHKVDEAGSEPYVIGFSQDITSRIQAERKLIEAKKLTEDSATAKETFLANLSHEIRTPMNGILGIAGLLAKTSLDEKQHNFLKLIQDSGKNLLAIVNDVLDLEKIIAGKLQLEKTPFKIVDKVAITVQSFIYRAEEKGVAIIFQNAIPPELVVLGDAFRLSQVLNNMLNNALKFTEQGSIVITTQIQSVENNTAMIEFGIKDTGIGISEKIMQQIFEPFVQASSDTSRKYGGTGLGLTICKSLLEMQGGDLNVQSREHVGSTFTFAIPYVISNEKLTVTDAPLELNFASLGKRKVLLAEDMELNQYIATHIMESWGFEVTVVGDGKQAVAMIEQADFDLVLMDIQMPEMDGMEATGIIRKLQDKRKSGITIIALTANALKNDSEKYIAAGMDDYLSKPFSEDKLFQVIARNLKPDMIKSPTMTPTQEPAPEILSHLKLYDLSMIISVSGGDEEFVKKMITLFIDTIPANLEQWNAQLAEANWDLVSKNAHKLKSTFDSMGVSSVSPDIRLVESYAKKGENLDQIPAMIQRINRVIKESIRQLTEALETGEAYK